MDHKINRIAYTGNMDKDSDVRYVGKGNNAGDGLDARNIQAVDAQGNVQGSIPPTLGNEFAFDLGQVSQQNKRYRITFDGDVTKQHELKFFSTQRDALMVVGSGPNGELQFNGTQLDFINAFNSAISGSGTSWLLSAPTATTVEIELASYPMYQWYLDSVGTDLVSFTCIAEAIPVDLAGPLKDIGSYDLLGDLFIFSTTQDNEPAEITPTIILVGPTSGGTYVGPLTSILFNGDHGLVQGQWIRITGSNESFLNGLFVVHSVIDAQTARIVTSTAWGVTPPVTTLGTPQVFINPSGIGEIGVAQKNENTDAWTYTRLLRSVELNFISKKKIDCFSKKVLGKSSSYITDNYNPPRLFVYTGTYLTDGALSFVYDRNIYEYDFINDDSLLQLPTSASVISLREQRFTTGSLYPGIKYYVVRQINSSQAFSDSTSISHPVLVTHYPDDDGNVFGREIAGALTGVRTTVSNILDITGLKAPEIYPLSQAICIESINGAITAEIVVEFKTPASGSFTVIDTGIDRVGPTDVAELISLGAQSRILRAKNIREIDQRNVLSNIATLASIDISAFAESIRHSIVKKKYKEATLDAVNEFQDAMVVKDSIGLMINETYRVGCRAYIKNLGWTDYFYVDDIKIDASPTNESNPFDNRRIAGLPDLQLVEIDPVDAATIPFASFEANGRLPNNPYTDLSGGTQSGYLATSGREWQTFFTGRTNPYEAKYQYCSPQLQFEIDWSVSIPQLGNASAGEVITAIEFGIADTPMSVKASGLGVFGVKDNPFSPLQNAATPNAIYEYPFVPFNYISGGVEKGAVVNYPYDFFVGDGVTNATELEQRSDVIAFYSPDYIINSGSEFSPEEASSLIICGSMESVKIIHNGSPFIPLSVSDMSFSLLHPSGTEYASPPEVIPVIDALKVSDKGSALVTFSNGEIFERADSSDKRIPTTVLQNEWPLVVPLRNNRHDVVVFRLSSPATAIAETTITKQFRGLVYVQAYRDERVNYRDKKLNIYQKIGETIAILPSPQSSVLVEGGDSFTTLFYYRNRGSIPDNPSNVIPFLTGSMMGLVGQSRVNVKMIDAAYLNTTPQVNTEFRTYPKNYTAFFSPSLPMTLGNERSALELWGSIDGIVLDVNNIPILKTIYQISDDYRWGRISPLFSLPSYQYFNDDAQGDLNREMTRIWWSEKSAIGEDSDAYRMFLPLNIKDLDPSFGEINHHENVNGELFTIQPRKWQQQLFNTRGELQVSGSAIGAIIGDGSVLSRDGQTLSRYGTQNKWSCHLGTSDGGKDTLYWYNAENGLFMRFGADGTIVISNRNNFRSYANKAAKWLRGKDTPAFDQGIRCVWDDRSKEVIWTFMGWRTNPQWAASPTFPIVTTPVGFVAVNANATSDTYENLPRFFVCKQSHTASAQNEPGVGPTWEDFWTQIAYDDFDHYSVFTVAFNEATNGFKTFYGHIPKTYLKWQDTFLSSHPVHRNLIFEHRRGEPTTWYGRTAAGIAPKIEDAHVEMVVNELPEQTTRGIAVRFLSKFIPQRVDYRTKRHHTWDEAAQFKQDGDQWTAPIRKDATVTGTPVQGGDILTGEYLRVKFTIFGGTYNLLHSIVVKYLDKARRINR
jgi:hypothetical protein